MTDGDGGAWGRATTGYGDEVAPPAGITSLKLAKYGWRERNVDGEQIWLKSSKVLVCECDIATKLSPRSPG